MTLSEWAERHFYLSAESSYVEGRWEAFPFQPAIMDCISNDDIREVWIRKSARVGYTKIILAAMGYFAHHKRRNQCIWQPVDDDADEFVKTELEPMIRDVPAVQHVFPFYNHTKAKQNTLRQKAFTGSTLHIRGGRAAKNYRRLSVDTAYFDEIDGFDIDVDGEGDPITLGGKRIEGALFPKLVGGSTPKHKGTSLISWRVDQADAHFRFNVPCPHCEHEQPLRFGGKDAPFGLKWRDRDPSTTAYLCEACGALFDQQDYLKVWERGRWRTDDGIYIDPQGLFRGANDERVETPSRVAFSIWTAYSPMATWSQIVREFLAAQDDPAKLKTFVNTTLGEEWEGEVESVEPETLLERREPFPADVPEGGVLVTAGVDVQDDRLEFQADAWGPGRERWTIDYEVIPGDPNDAEVWEQLDELFERPYRHELGFEMTVWSAVVDSGGHHTQIVYDYCRKRYKRRIYAAKDIGGPGRPLVSAPTRKGTARTVKKVALYTIGKDEARTRIYSALSVSDPDRPRYWHFPDAPWCNEEYFDQLTGEVLVTQFRNGFPEKVWKKRRPRQEALSVSIYSLAALHLASRNPDRMLQRRAQDLRQAVEDTPAAKAKAAPKKAKSEQTPAQAAPKPKGRKRGRRKRGSSYLSR